MTTPWVAAPSRLAMAARPLAKTSTSPPCITRPMETSAPPQAPPAAVEDLGELASLLVGRAEMREEIGKAEAQAEQLRWDNSLLKSQLQSEAARSAAAEAQCDVACAQLAVVSDQLDAAEDSSWRRREQESAMQAHVEDVASIRIGESEERVEELMALVVQPLQQVLARLQASHVAQTRDFSFFTEAVKHQELRAEQALAEVRADCAAEQALAEDARDQRARSHCEQIRLSEEFYLAERGEMKEAHSCRCEREAAQQEFRQLVERHSQASDNLQLECSELSLRAGVAERQLLQSRSEAEELSQLLEERSNRLLERHVAASCGTRPLPRSASRSIAHEMFVALEGRMLDKVHEQNNKREPRFVALDDAAMRLSWAKAAGKLGDKASHLDLGEVLRIEFGCAARSYRLHQAALPWMCFSLYTSRRSYDFISPDEVVTQSFVLAISRLCHLAAGAIGTRRDFIAARGWCKFEATALKQRKTRMAVLRDAAARTLRRSGASDDMSDVCSSESQGSERAVSAEAEGVVAKDVPEPRRSIWERVGRLRPAVRLTATARGIMER